MGWAAGRVCRPEAGLATLTQGKAAPLASWLLRPGRRPWDTAPFHPGARGPSEHPISHPHTAPLPPTPYPRIQIPQDTRPPQTTPPGSPWDTAPPSPQILTLLGHHPPIPNTTPQGHGSPWTPAHTHTGPPTPTCSLWGPRWRRTPRSPQPHCARTPFRKPILRLHRLESRQP